MSARHVAVIFAVAIITASCSENPATEPEKDVTKSEPSPEPSAVAKVEPAAGDAALRPPPESKIAKDCVALVRATKVVPAPGANKDCPGCPAGGTEVLTYRQMKPEALSCSGDTCSVVVTIRAMFNPGSGETLSGGLTAWIPPEQRSAYLSGHVPSDEQAFRVQITYKHRGGGWRAVEFDRAPAE